MKREYKLLYLLALVKFILPFILQDHSYQPQRDEFLYVAEAHHLAWGYMEVPPLLSIFIWFGNLFGGGFFWMKFWPSLFGALTYVLAGRIVISFRGSFLALVLAFLPFVFGAFLRMHYLLQPNFLEIFFWTLIAFSILRYVQTQKSFWLYVFGVSAGLGMLSKYSVAFFIISILLAALLTPVRKIFANRHFYFAAIIGFVIFLPNLVWQYVHGFPVIYHMHELNQTQLQYVSPVTFLTDQVLMNVPVVFIWMAGIYFAVAKEKGRYMIFAWAYIFVILLLLYFHGKSYYAVGVYPVLFALGAVHLERFAISHSKVWRYVFIVIPILLGVPLVPLMLPVAKPATLASYYHKIGVDNIGLTKWEDLKNHPLPQDFADMLGWKEMTEKTAKAYAALTEAEKKKTIIFADNYGEAGAVNFYGHQYNLPEVYSANASYLYWLPANFHIDNLILITDDRHEMQKPFLHDFQSVTLNDSITDPYAREYGSLIITLKGANEQFNQMMQKKLAAEWAKFRKR